MAKAVEATWVSQGGAWVPLAMTPPPGPPVNILGVYYDSTQNSLTWDEPLEPENVVSYEVHYSAAGAIAKPGDGTFLTSVPVGATRYYLHTRAAGENDLPHYYSVFGKTATGLKGEHATTMVEKGLPPIPRSFNAAGASTTSMNLSWAPPSPVGSATGYRLLFKLGSYPTGPTDAAATVLLDAAPLTTTTYTHTGLTTDTSYYYLLCCTSDLGYGASIKDTAKTLKPPPPLPGALVNFGAITGWLGCLWWADWQNPTNCAVDADYNIDNFKFRGQANTQTPPGTTGGVHLITYTSVSEGTAHVYYRFPPMDDSNSAATNHSISGYASNVTGTGAPAGVWDATGNSNPCGARSVSAEGTLEDAEPQRKTMYEKWCGMPFPDDESQAWVGVEMQLANTDEEDIEGWWARLLMSIDVLAYKGGVSQEVVDTGTEIVWPESTVTARASLPQLREHIALLVANRMLDEVYLTGVEAIRAWHFLGRE